MTVASTMNERSNWRDSFKLRLGRGLGALSLSAMVAVVPGCDEAMEAVETAGDTPVESVSGPLAEAEKPAPSAMKMTRQDAPQAVATEQVPEVVPVQLRTEPVITEPEPLPAEREVLEVRTARQRLTVRIAPDRRAPLRARIPMGESFEIFELVEGRGCGGKGWADVGNGGFACLEKTRAATHDPRPMPIIRDGRSMPFFFAQNKKGVPARRWSSMKSYLAGDEPVSVLSPGRDFAFASRRMVKGKALLLDKRGRVMMERDLKRFRPSRFAGRDLIAEPVPEGKVLAWTIGWPETKVRAEANGEAEVVGMLDHQVQIYVKPEPVKVASGTFYERVDGGYVNARKIRRWQAPAPLAEAEQVAEDEIWIDVELDQQVLTVVRGSTPIFATMISSGRKGPTPHGLFRVRQKHAYTGMSSSPGAADSYAVEAVPFAQYFHGGIALHAAYWHNLFGTRVSHGCINLSPADAATVYEFTGPHPRDGWMDVYEDEGDLGSRVRIHDGDEVVVDRRKPIEHIAG